MTETRRAANPDDLVTTDIERAAAAITSGGVVAMPTETVYGLAADATDDDAVRRVFDIKGRPHDHPLILHVGSPDALDRWTSEPSIAARTLTATAWPGPLTVIVPRSANVSDVITGGRDAVAVRMPAHPVALELLAATGTALVAPSANRFGSVSPTTAQHVVDDLADRLDPATDLVLDGGPCRIGIESTIVDTTVSPPQLLRAGAISGDEVAALIADDVGAASGPSRASGMLASHYAPRCEVRLVDHADDAIALRAGTPGADVLDLTHDLALYARRLYAELRAADDRGTSVLIAVLPPPNGLGLAIRDRLEKAAAPRLTSRARLTNQDG